MRCRATCARGRALALDLLPDLTEAADGGAAGETAAGKAREPPAQGWGSRRSLWPW